METTAGDERRCAAGVRTAAKEKRGGKEGLEEVQRGRERLVRESWVRLPVHVPLRSPRLPLRRTPTTTAGSPLSPAAALATVLEELKRCEETVETLYKKEGHRLHTASSLHRTPCDDDEDEDKDTVVPSDLSSGPSDPSPAVDTDDVTPLCPPDTTLDTVGVSSNPPDSCTDPAISPDTLANIDLDAVRPSDPSIVITGVEPSELASDVDENAVNSSGLASDVDENTVKTSGLVSDVDKNAVILPEVASDLDKNAVEPSGLSSDSDKIADEPSGLTSNVNVDSVVPFDSCCDINAVGASNLPSETSTGADVTVVLHPDNSDSDLTFFGVSLNDTDDDCSNDAPAHLEEAGETEERVSLALEGKVPRLSCGPGDTVDLSSPSRPPAASLVNRFIRHVKLRPSSERNPPPPPESIVEGGWKRDAGNLGALKEALRKAVQRSRALQFTQRLQQHYKETGGSPDDGEESDADKEAMSRDKASDAGDSGVEGDSDEENGGDGEVGSDAECSDSEECSDEELRGDSDDADSNKDVEEPLCDRNEFIEDQAEESADESGENCNSEGEDSSEDHSPGKLNLSSLGLDPEVEGDGELVGLCSGQFKSQVWSLTQLEQLSAQEREEPRGDGANTSQLSTPHREESGGEEEKEEGVPLRSARTSKPLRFSDDEEDEETADIEKTEADNVDAESEADNVDAESEADNADAESEADNADEESESAAGPDTRVIYYDSEEEVVEGRRFLEAEAELSGEEGASEDEDEAGLSDVEHDLNEADLQHFDQTRLKNQLHQIHLKEVLAEDRREVRLLQELLLEDGELHSDGPKRERRFRWTHLDDGGSVEWSRSKLSDDDDDMNASADDEEDAEWRQRRSQRLTFLDSVAQGGEDGGDRTEVDDNTVGRVVKVGTRGANRPLPPPPPPSSCSPEQPLHSNVRKRGSFLGRGDKMLARLASLPGATAPLQQQSRPSTNMVFASLSPPQPLQMEKRKPEDAAQRVTKRLKFDTSAVPKRSTAGGLLRRLTALDTSP